MSWRGAGIGSGSRLRPRAGSGVGAIVVVTLVISIGSAGCAGSDPPVSTPSGPVAESTVTESMVTESMVAESVPPTAISSPAALSTTESSAPETTSAPGPAPTTAPIVSDDGPLAPPRVEFADDPDRQAVVDAAYAFFDAARAAQADPADEALRTRLAATMTEPIAERMSRFLDGLVLDGVRIIANPNSPTYLQIFEPSVSQVDDSGLVDVCAVDSDIRIDATTGAVIDDDVVSSTQSYLLSFVAGTWRVRDFVVAQVWEDTVGCE